MELTPKQYADIQRYTDGLMTENEQQKFEKELEQNPLLREQLAFEQELQLRLGNLLNEEDEIGKWMAETEAAAEPAEAAHWQKQIAAVAANWEKKEAINDGKITSGRTDKESGATKVIALLSNKRVYWLSAAACTVALLGVWLLWPKPQPAGPDGPVVVKKDTPKTKPPDSGLAHINPIDTASKKNYPPIITPSVPPTRLFAENFEPDATPREKPEYLLAQLDAYDGGNVQPILDADLEHIPKSRGDRGADEQAATRATGRYYQGLAYLKLDSNSKAITAFTEVRKNAPADSLRRKATWYLAMAYLEKGKGKEAKPLLQQLSANKEAGKYGIKSRKILKEME